MSKGMKNRLFGTDGVRGAFGEYPLDKESIVKLGNALGRLMKGSAVVIGRDTRQSGEEITRLLTSGMGDGVNAVDCGVIPTPGISYITGHNDFDYGIMITASHNPWTDNGIKIFNTNGEKIPDNLERDVEDLFFSMVGAETGAHRKVPVSEEYKIIYRDFLLKAAGPFDREKLKVFNIVLDCANGAVFETAPAVFEKAGFNISVIHAAPDGKNINLDCGSTEPEQLARVVSERQADIGIAFDGDGDRVMMTDNKGNILDGDFTLYLIANYFKETADHFNPVVVGTVMGNLGLESAIREMGMSYIRTPVGDRHVYRGMIQHNASLGGEQSGHTILRDFQETGDGILTALYFLKALFYFDLEPTDVFQRLRLYPQVLKSIKVKEKPQLSEWDELNRMIDRFNEDHGANSRVLIRYSGTEPKLRLMMESDDESVIAENIEKFEHLIKSTIGI
jgi:phosphoglucosamine mutase